MSTNIVQTSKRPDSLHKSIIISPDLTFRFASGEKVIDPLWKHVQHIKGLDNVAQDTEISNNHVDYLRQAKTITSYLTPSIGEERQVCSGVITSNYLDLEQIKSNNIILTYEEGPRRTGMKDSKNLELRSFAVCRIEELKGNFDNALGYNKFSSNVNEYTLYIDVICSKSRDGSNWLWKQINEIAIKLKISVKLSSLSYVAAYYKRKKNFNFYTIPESGPMKENTELNSLLENKAWPFFSEDAKHEIPKTRYKNWLDYLNEKLNPTGGFTTQNNNKDLGALKKRLDDLLDDPAKRRASLPERLGIVKEIMEILKSQNDEEGFQMVQKFFVAAIDANVAVGANIHVLTRETDEQTAEQRVKTMLAVHDIGDNGFTMLSIP